MKENKNWTIIQGDALKVLEAFAPGTFDAVITDPPYASGGRTQAEKTNPPSRNIPAWAKMRLRLLTETQRISGAGHAGRRNGCILPEGPANPVPRSACSPTGGRLRRRLTPSSGQAGFGVEPPYGIRETADHSEAASALRRSILFGAATEICPSPGPCPVCPGYSGTGTPRSGFISRKSRSCSCGMW